MNIPPVQTPDATIEQQERLKPKAKTTNQIGALLEFLNKTQQEFAQEIDISQSAVSQLMNNRTTMSLETLIKISNTYGIDCNWLVLGKGFEPNGENGRSPIISGKGGNFMTVTVNANNEPEIVLVPVKAQAGYAVSRIDAEYLQDLPVLRLPSSQFKHGTFRAFEVDGKSMEPTLRKSEMIITSLVENLKWIKDYDLYVFVLENDVLVKRACNNIALDGTIVLISDNPNYPPLVRNASEIVEAWKVEAKITTELPDVTDNAAVLIREFKEKAVAKNPNNETDRRINAADGTIEELVGEEAVNTQA